MTMIIDRLSVMLGSHPALEDVTAQLAPGTVTAILGPNGAGKSTLLACMAGLLHPDSGCVTLDGTNIASLPPRERAQRIGFIAQAAEVHWNIDVRTLVALGRLPHRAPFAADTDADRRAVEQAMAATGVTHLADRPTDTLSGGERARALFARALAGQPAWLLADEPLANLDPAHQLDALALLRAAAANGTGVVVVLHDLTQAARVADRILLLRDGRCIADGSPAQALRPETLARVYGVDVHIGVAQSGEPVVVPLRRCAGERAVGSA